MVPVLVQAGYRVVVPDFIGFGKSDKYSAMANYTHEMHLFCLKHLMEGLDLTSRVTLVCQDWGGIKLPLGHTFGHGYIRPNKKEFSPL